MSEPEFEVWAVRRLRNLVIALWVIFALICLLVGLARAECTRPYFDTDATSFVMKCYPRSDMETNPDYLDAQEIIKHGRAIQDRHKPPCNCCDSCSQVKDSRIILPPLEDEGQWQVWKGTPNIGHKNP